VARPDEDARLRACLRVPDRGHEGQLTVAVEGEGAESSAENPVADGGRPCHHQRREPSLSEVPRKDTGSRRPASLLELRGEDQLVLVVEVGIAVCGAEHLVLDHYLDVLRERPSAFPGSLPLHQAREQGEFPPSYDRLWSKLRERSGDKQGTRQMIEVLLLHRHHPTQIVRRAVEQALAVGAIDPGAIALLARHLGTVPDEPPVQLSLVDVGELSRYERPVPETTSYDALLAGVGR
jgi:hypothetical protein